MEYWALYRVAFPSGTMQAYNYATIRIYQDFSLLENPLGMDDFRAVFEEFDQAQLGTFLDDTESTRDIVRSEVFELVSTTIDSYASMGRYVEMDYMDTPEGKEAGYVNAEDKYWKPMQEQRIKNELMTGWDLWKLKYPTGTGEAYDFVTVNFFDSYSKLAWPDYPPDVISGAHPDFATGDFDRIVEETLRTRSMVQMQLWIRLEQTMSGD